jgi:hypothetical protein
MKGNDFMQNMRIILFFHSLLAFSAVGAVYYLYRFDPVRYVYFITEDSFAEHGTFVGYLLSFLLMAVSMLLSKELRKPGYVLLLLGFFFIAMEEVSWGQRFLGIKTPYIFNKYNLQRETNLHNLIDFKLNQFFAYVVLLWITVIPLLERYSDRVRALCQKVGLPVVRGILVPYFAAALYFIFLHPISKSDEVGEYLSSIAFLAYSLSMLLACRQIRGNKVKSQIKWGLSVLIIAFVLTSALCIAYPYGEGNIRWRFNDFATKKFPRYKAYDQADILFEYIIKNPSLMTDDTKIQYGYFLMKRGSEEKAFRMFQESLDEIDQRIQRGQAMRKDYHKMGLLYMKMGYEKKAAKMFHEALAAKENAIRNNQKRR